MDTADREKTAFLTHGRLYEFRVMPFGLVNARTRRPIQASDRGARTLMRPARAGTPGGTLGPGGQGESGAGRISTPRMGKAEGGEGTRILRGG